MIKAILKILLFCFFVSSAFCQTSKSTFLPTQIGALEELKPFFTDTTSQILFNPAKAVITDKEFIMADRVPFKFFGLRELKNKKKLFYRFDFQKNNSIRNNDYNFFGENYLSTSESETTSSKDYNFLNLSFIDNSSSIGIFGFLRKSLNEFENFSRNSSQSESGFSLYNLDRNSKGKLNNFAFGTSYSNFKNDKEFLAEISYEYYNFKNNFNQESNNTNFINADSLEQINEYDFKSSNSKKYSRLNFSIYLKNKLNLFSKNDFYFFSLNGFYQPKGELNYSYELRFIQQITQFGFIEDLNRLLPESDYKLKSKILTANLALGYVWKKKIGKLNFLLSSAYKFGFSNEDEPLETTFDSIYFNRYISLSVNEPENTVINNSIIFPFHFEYIPNNWFRLIGGYSFETSHNFYLKEELTRSEHFDIEEDESSKSSYLEKYKSYDFETRQNVYLGMRLNHKTGFFIETSFSSSFDIFKQSRYIILGYEF